MFSRARSECRIQKQFRPRSKSLRDQTLLKRVRAVIEDVEQAQSLSQISNLKKLKGHANYYRIRIGDYRVGIMIAEDTVIFVRFLNRKDIYKYFP